MFALCDACSRRIPSDGDSTGDGEEPRRPAAGLRHRCVRCGGPLSLDQGVGRKALQLGLFGLGRGDETLLEP